MDNSDALGSAPRRVRRSQNAARKEPLTMVAASVPVSDYRVLVDLADTDGTSVSAIVRKAIELLPGFKERREVYQELEQATTEVANG